MYVRLSDGSSGQFDLLVGADGVHSQIRQLAFDDTGQFERFLGYYTAAFILDEPLGPRDAWATLIDPGRQVGVYPIRGDRTAALFIYQAQRALDRLTADVARQELRAAYSNLSWIVPTLLDRARDAPDLYFDPISQVIMPR